MRFKLNYKENLNASMHINRASTELITVEFYLRINCCVNYSVHISNEESKNVNLK